MQGHLVKMKMTAKGKRFFCLLALVGTSRYPVRNMLKEQYPGANQTHEPVISEVDRSALEIYTDSSACRDI